MADYLSIGYDNLLTKSEPLDLSRGITTENADQAIASGVIGFGATSMDRLYTNQDIQSSNFVSGSNGWRIKGDGTAEFQTVIAGDYIKIFVQDGIPTSEHLNDLWVDSNDNNKRYRSASVGADQITAGEWEAIDNPTEWDNVLDGASHKPTDNATVGAIFGTNISGGGSGANQISNSGYIDNLNANTINVGTLTGFTVQTSADGTGKRIKMYSDKIEIYNSSNVVVGTIEGGDTTGIFDIIGLDTVGAINAYSINTDGLIAMDLADLAISTRRTAGNGGDIKLIPEIGQDVTSTEDINLASGKQYKINGVPIGSGGETNTASNKGGTQGWYSNKSGVDLQFKGLSVSSRLSLSSYSNYLYLDHATGSGYNHIPSSGSSNKFLKYSAAGTAVWASAVYSVATSGAITGGTITGSGTISHRTSSGYKHLPSSGTTYQMLRNSSSGTASWTSSLYVGNSSSYALYLNSSMIRSTVGMYFGGNSTCAGTLSAIGELRATNGSIHTSGNIYTGGISANEGSVNCAIVQGDGGGIWLDYTGRLQTTTHFDPPNAGGYNSGGSTRYWNAINAKFFTKQGGFGSFDEGVELQNGEIVSDIEAIMRMKEHPTMISQYGVKRIDPNTIPKIVIHRARNYKGELLLRDKNDIPYEIAQEDTYGNDNNSKKILLNKKGDKLIADDGEDLGAMMSIIIGAIKELTNKIQILEIK